MPARWLLSGVGDSRRELSPLPTSKREPQSGSAERGEGGVGDLDAARTAAQRRSVPFPLPESPSKEVVLQPYKHGLLKRPGYVSSSFWG